MSEKHTIVGKLLQEVFNIFKRNWPSFIKKLINKVPDDVSEIYSVGIFMVQNIKTFLEGDVAKFITHVIPGDLDEEIRLKAIEVLTKVMQLDENLHSIGKNEMVINNRGIALGLASELNAQLMDIPFPQSTITTQVLYEKLKADNKLD